MKFKKGDYVKDGLLGVAYVKEVDEENQQYEIVLLESELGCFQDWVGDSEFLEEYNKDKVNFGKTRMYNRNNDYGLKCLKECGLKDMIMGSEAIEKENELMRKKIAENEKKLEKGE